jgi:hypothetical protein
MGGEEWSGEARKFGGLWWDFLRLATTSIDFGGTFCDLRRLLATFLRGVFDRKLLSNLELGRFRAWKYARAEFWTPSAEANGAGAGIDGDKPR